MKQRTTGNHNMTKDIDDNLTPDLEIHILKQNVYDLNQQLTAANKRIKELTDALHNAGIYPVTKQPNEEWGTTD